MAKDLKTPTISVVMSVFNGDIHLRKAIQSILDQDFTDFEFIIIDDGSTDGTKHIIESFKDKRIHMVSRENRGLVYSLNQGIELARGEFIARMDADDISSPDRFSKQLALLHNEKADIVGSSFEAFDDKTGNRLSIYSPPMNDIDIKRSFFIRNPLGHGSVLFRKKILLETGGYKEIGPAEDYDLWIRMYKHKFACHSDILYYWRVNPGGISQSKASEQADLARKLRKNLSENEIIPKLSSFMIIYRYFLESRKYPKGASFKNDYARDQLEIGKNYFIKNSYSEGVKQYATFLLLFPSSVRIIYSNIMRRMLSFAALIKRRVGGK